MKRGRYLPMWLAMAGLGCTDLDHFSTGQGESYCGSITVGGSFRTGFSPLVQMRLKLSVAQLDGPGVPGKLSTFEAGDASRPERRLLDEADLRRIPAVESDAISGLEFGYGRLRNAMFAVSPADPSPPDGGPAQDPGALPEAESILAILSLRNDDAVEVRLLRPGLGPAGDAGVPEGRRPLFGIFPLTRQVGACGF